MNDDAPKASRRSILRAGAAILAAGAVVKHAAAEETQKIEKSLVGYVEKSVDKDGHHCSICANFQAPSSCAIVAGTINPNGWCGAFAPKG
jgi:hypothetical protein